MKLNTILIRYGEIALKGKVTRATFEKRLIKNIEQAMHDEHISFIIRNIQGRILIETDEIKKGIEIISHIFGVTSCSPAEQLTFDLSLLKKKAFDIIDNLAEKNNSFALRITRVGSHTFSSQDVAIEVGAYIQKQKNYPVNLTKPDIELFIEIRDQYIFLYTEKIRGPGGMPLKSQGNIISIIEDSHDLLATWYLMKRGCNMIFYFQNPKILKNSHSFFSKWYIHKPIIIEGINQLDYNDINSIIKRYRCKALCSGINLSNKPDKTIQKIKELKEKIKLPILTPNIFLKMSEIRKQCKEKGIAQ